MPISLRVLANFIAILCDDVYWINLIIHYCIELPKPLYKLSDDNTFAKNEVNKTDGQYIIVFI